MAIVEAVRRSGSWSNNLYIRLFVSGRGAVAYGALVQLLSPAKRALPQALTNTVSVDKINLTRVQSGVVVAFDASRMLPRVCLSWLLRVRRDA
jgi:hypothetical protein